MPCHLINSRLPARPRNGASQSQTRQVQRIAEYIHGGDDNPPPIVHIKGDMDLSSDISILPADALVSENAIDIVEDMIREIQRSVTPDVEMTELIDPSDTQEDVNALESSLISAVGDDQEAKA